MPWVTITAKQVAKELGIDYEEQEQKQELIRKIVQIRQTLGLTQAQVAKLLGVSQSRIAKIESFIGVHKVSFDLLFRLLAALGYHCKIIPQKRREKLAA
jgi:transcriptional regulator with XRE-family HTH domain